MIKPNNFEDDVNGKKRRISEEDIKKRDATIASKDAEIARMRDQLSNTSNALDKKTAEAKKVEAALKAAEQARGEQPAVRLGSIGQTGVMVHRDGSVARRRRPSRPSGPRIAVRDRLGKSSSV